MAYLTGVFWIIFMVFWGIFVFRVIVTNCNVTNSMYSILSILVKVDLSILMLFLVLNQAPYFHE